MNQKFFKKKYKSQSNTVRPVVTAHLPPPFFCVFAKTLYVRFVPTGEHLDIACFSTIEKKVEKR
jgi:hypothetical protein